MGANIQWACRKQGEHAAHAPYDEPMTLIMVTSSASLRGGYRYDEQRNASELESCTSVEWMCRISQNSEHAGQLGLPCTGTSDCYETRILQRLSVFQQDDSRDRKGKPSEDVLQRLRSISKSKRSAIASDSHKGISWLNKRLPGGARQREQLHLGEGDS